MIATEELLINYFLRVSQVWDLETTMANCQELLKWWQQAEKPVFVFSWGAHKPVAMKNNGHQHVYDKSDKRSAINNRDYLLWNVKRWITPSKDERAFISIGAVRFVSAEYSNGVIVCVEQPGYIRCTSGQCFWEALLADRVTMHGLTYQVLSRTKQRQRIWPARPASNIRFSVREKLHKTKERFQKMQSLGDFKIPVKNAENVFLVSVLFTQQREAGCSVTKTTAKAHIQCRDVINCGKVRHAENGLRAYR